MKAHLMHRDRDFDANPELPWSARALTQDLALEPLLAAMAAEDALVLRVARRALFGGLTNGIDTILYRQANVKDCLAYPAVIRDLYALAVKANDRETYRWYSVLSRHPGGILYESIGVLRILVGLLRALRGIADEHAANFTADGFTALFALIEQELSDAYFATVEAHLDALEFRKGVLVSAHLGEGNAGREYVLRKPHERKQNWVRKMLGKAPPAYTYRLHPRDEAGARALSALRDQGVNLVANAVAQSTDHIRAFFSMLQTELAFYVGCLNLHERLLAKGERICFPEPKPAADRDLSFGGLYDASLALTMTGAVVGNSADADGKSLIVITGANQGGKSTFLRSIGLAQLMMQAGMFVPSERFSAGLCSGLFTHYKREEDRTMTRGKLDEELARMSETADHLVPDSMLLFNESFASTNEREGSEIAGQIVSALLDKKIRVFFVTHQHAFARSMFDRKLDQALFLRAERLPDGTRTFRVVEGEPLETSYGEDLYHEVFGAEAEPVGTMTAA